MLILKRHTPHRTPCRRFSWERRRLACSGSGQDGRASRRLGDGSTPRLRRLPHTDGQNESCYSHGKLCTWTEVLVSLPLKRGRAGVLSGVGFFISPLPEAGGGEGEGEELGVVTGPAHPHPDPPPSRGREKKGRFRKNLPQKGARVGVQSLPPHPNLPPRWGEGVQKYVSRYLTCGRISTIA